MSRRFFRSLSCVLFAALVIPSFIYAEDAAPERQDVHAKRKAIQKALTKQVNWKFDEEPLADVVKTLQKELGIPILLDDRTLNDLGVTSDTPLTFEISGISAKSAMHLMLHKLGLIFTIRNEVLFITSPEEAENCLTTIVYDVTDLVLGDDESVGLNFDVLIDVMTKTIKPTSWDDVGGSGSVQPFTSAGIITIVVSQTDDVHDKVVDLLADLRSMRHPGKAKQKSEPANPGTPVSKRGLPELTVAQSAEKAAENRILKALKKRISWDFREKPLKEVAEFLEKELKEKVLIDAKTLEDLGVAIDAPITKLVSDTTAANAMDLLLHDLGLTYMIRDQAILITSPEETENYLMTRTYDVSDLPAYRTENGEAVPDFDSLIELIGKTIRPTSWDDVGGPASIQPIDSGNIQALVVHQTLQAHSSIADLLDDLRKQRNTPLTKEEIEKLPPMPEPKAGEGGGMGIIDKSGKAVEKLPPLMPDAARESVVQSNNKFAFDLYAQLSGNSKENVFFSPHSLASALAMAYAGAGGETAQEMAKTLRFTLKQDEIPQGYRALLDATLIADRPGCELNVANRLWCQQGYKFRDSFLAVNRDQFGSEIGLIDFKQSKAARKQINDWIDEKTKGRIENALDESSPNGSYRFMITDAVYFKGKWELQFEKSETKDEPFYADDETKNVPMMVQKSAQHRYAEIEDVKILEKPYLGGDISMLIVLPEKKPDALKKLESELTSEKLQEWIGSLKKREVNLYLPRFEMRTSYPLNGALEQLGMKRAFSPSEADFSGMKEEREPLWIDKIAQLTFLRVDEEGTEAAAVTFMGGAGGMPLTPPKVYVFRADHPFLFFLRDNRTGCILFMGRIASPPSDEKK